jgi:hypothetical protein
MTEKITVNIDTMVTEQQAKLIATYLTEKYCFAWIDIAGNEYNPECRHYSEADLTVLLVATNNQWEFYFIDAFTAFKKGVECAI